MDAAGLKNGAKVRATKRKVTMRNKTKIQYEEKFIF
jgi:hypothetical protein